MCMLALLQSHCLGLLLYAPHSLILDNHPYSEPAMQMHEHSRSGQCHISLTAPSLLCQVCPEIHSIQLETRNLNPCPLL